MNRELIFNNKKWFDGEVSNYIGKKITKEARTTFYNMNASGPAKVSIDTVNEQATVKAQTMVSGKIYLNAKKGSALTNGWFLVDEFLKNGGVSHSLNHIRQGLRSLFRKEVIAC